MGGGDCVQTGVVARTQTAGRPGEALPWGSPEPLRALPLQPPGARGGASLHTGRPLQAWLSWNTRPRQGPLCLVYAAWGRGRPAHRTARTPSCAPVWNLLCGWSPQYPEGLHTESASSASLGEQSREWASPWEVTATALLPTIDKHGQAPRKTSRSDSPWPQGMHGALTGWWR